MQIYSSGDTGISITSGTSHYGSIYFGDATSGEFAVDGNNTCYIGSTFTFDNIQLDVPDGQEIDASLINVSKLNDEGDYEPLGFSSARMINGIFEITFDNDLIQK